jgi:arginyl-tRNA synthetase
MNALAEIKTRFADALNEVIGAEQASDQLLGMIRETTDGKFGDYQANFAMPLAKKLGKPPRDVASSIVDSVQLSDVCSKIEIAGPGFINLTLDDGWVKARLAAAVSDDRLGVVRVASPRKFVVDYSSPNVAKPMHVGHIRSTVIGDALARVLRFVGHDVITDNHLGDWGTQFGMIIYGYKHFMGSGYATFLEPEHYQKHPIDTLGQIYKLVRTIMDFHSASAKLPDETEKLQQLKSDLASLEDGEPPTDKAEIKKHKKQISAARNRIADQQGLVDQLMSKVSSVVSDLSMHKLAVAHPEINQAVLLETAALHEGDEQNKQLWDEFLPHCREDIQRIYQRLNVSFDYELGESFFHDMLADVANEFEAKGLARTSDGALCVFMDQYETPMIIRKQDGAFLYATTDLATIKYRLNEWNADAILYVVDHRQHQHFEKVFDAVKLWGHDDAELVHVSFGTVLGEDGRPFKTRSGDTVNLETLLDEAETRAIAIAKEANPDLAAEQQENIGRVVGIGGLKYADLSQHRASDYKFSYEKMLAMKGNTATYLQYSYARVQGILRRLETDLDQLRGDASELVFEKPIERTLAVKLVRLGESLDEVLVEYKPNLLCNYLFELTQNFFQFYDQCSVKDASSEAVRVSRLKLCDLTARTIENGLGLLGIGVLEQM